MRNFKELSELETLLIKFSIFSSAIQVISNGLESSRSTDISDTMYYIQDAIKTFNVEFRTAFDKAWEASKEPLQSSADSSYPYRTTTGKSLDEAYDEVTRADFKNGFR